MQLQVTNARQPPATRLRSKRMDIGEIAKLLGLVSAVVALAEIARRTKLPYPTLMVVAGLIIGFVPGMPKVEPEPELIFLVFLPPILYAAEWNT